MEAVRSSGAFLRGVLALKKLHEAHRSVRFFEAFVTRIAPTSKLWLFDANGALRPGAPMAIGTACSMDGTHVSVNAAGAGVVTCQGLKSDPVSFRRFDMSTANFVDGATVPIAASSGGHSSHFDSHLVGINSAGGFAVVWTDFANQLDRAAIFDAAGVLQNALTLGASANGRYDTTAYDVLTKIHYRLPTLGTDFIIPFHDDANAGGGIYFNSYARCTAAGVSKGTQSSAGQNMMTLAVGSGSPIYTIQNGALVKNPFTLIP